MTEYELYKMITETIRSIDDYNKSKIIKGIWQDDIKKSIPELIEKSHVLNASGNTCPNCGGSGRV